jgi:hypothetical protein
MHQNFDASCDWSKASMTASSYPLRNASQAGLTAFIVSDEHDAFA